MNEEDIFDGGEPEPAVEPAPETPPEPVEPPVELTPEQEAEKDKAEEERKRKTGSQRAREKAMRLELENQALRDALARGTQKAPEPEPVRPQAADGRPDPEDPKFKSYEDYLDALTDWKVESRLRQVEAHKAQQAQVETFHTKLQAAHEAHPDLADLLDDLQDAGVPPPTETMQKAIQASESGADLLYHLAKNPSEVKRIGALPPVAQAMELGVLLGQMKAHAGHKPNETKQTTKAPAPVTPLRGSGMPAVPKSRFEEF